MNTNPFSSSINKNTNNKPQQQQSDYSITAPDNSIIDLSVGQSIIVGRGQYGIDIHDTHIGRRHCTITCINSETTNIPVLSIQLLSINPVYIVDYDDVDIDNQQLVKLSNVIQSIELHHNGIIYMSKVNSEYKYKFTVHNNHSNTTVNKNNLLTINDKQTSKPSIKRQRSNQTRLKRFKSDYSDAEQIILHNSSLFSSEIEQPHNESIHNSNVLSYDDVIVLPPPNKPPIEVIDLDNTGSDNDTDYAVINLRRENKKRKSNNDNNVINVETKVQSESHNYNDSVNLVSSASLHIPTTKQHSKKDSAKQLSVSPTGPFQSIAIYILGSYIGKVQQQILSTKVARMGGKVLNKLYKPKQHELHNANAATNNSDSTITSSSEYDDDSIDNRTVVIIVTDIHIHSAEQVLQQINQQLQSQHIRPFKQLDPSYQCVRLQWLIDSLAQRKVLPYEQYTIQLNEQELQQQQQQQEQQQHNNVSDVTSAYDTSSYAAHSDNDTNTTIDSQYDTVQHNMTTSEIIKHNKRIADALLRLSDLYTLPGEQMRKHIFQRASKVIRNISDQAILSGGQARKFKGIGQSIAHEIDLILSNQQSMRAQLLHDDAKLQSLRELQTVHGIGGATAERLYNAGMRTVADLQLNEEWLRLTREQRTYLQYYDELKLKMPRREVEQIHDIVRNVVDSIDKRIQITICGSYRRGNAMVGDVDLICTHPHPDLFDMNNITFRQQYSPTGGSVNTYQYHCSKDKTSNNIHAQYSGSKADNERYQRMSFRRIILEEIVYRLKQLTPPFITDDLQLPHEAAPFRRKSAIIYHNVMSRSEHEAYLGICKLPYEHSLHRRLDIIVYGTAAYPMCILGWTAQTEFNRALRHMSDKKYGLLLSDHSISPFRRVKGGRLGVGALLSVQCSSDIFHVLGLPYTLPEQTTNLPQFLLDFEWNEDQSRNGSKRPHNKPYKFT